MLRELVRDLADAIRGHKMHPLYEITEAWVGTMFAIRVVDLKGCVVLQRNRRPQPPQGGDYEITVEELRSLIGRGTFRVDIIDATRELADPLDALYASPFTREKVYASAVVRI